MSRSNQTDERRNPSARWFEWEGKNQRLKYWDKERKENIPVDLPFTFLVLDELSTITGWHRQRNEGIFANEVRNTKTEAFSVRTKKGPLHTALYDDFKSDPDCDYTKSLYIAFYDGEELKIGNLKLVRSANREWIEFARKNNIYDGAVTLVRADKRNNNGIEFFVPVFEMKNKVSAETEAKAQELDKILQTYLNEYFVDNHVDLTELRLQSGGQPKGKELVTRWTPPSQREEQESPFAEPAVDDDDIPF